MPRYFSFTGVGVVFLGLFGFVVAGAAQGQKVGAPPEASNMRLAGYDNLQHRSAYQPTIFHQGNRWIAYIGHHGGTHDCLLYTSPSPRDRTRSRMPSSA